MQRIRSFRQTASASKVPPPGRRSTAPTLRSRTGSDVGVVEPLRVVAIHAGSELVPTISTTAPAQGSLSVAVPAAWGTGGDYQICVTGQGGAVSGCSGALAIVPNGGLASCVGDSDCVFSEFCDNGQCVLDNCHQGEQYCVGNDVWVCTANGSTGNPEQSCLVACVDGQCTAGCQSDAGCPSDQHCSATQCAADVCPQTELFCTNGNTEIWQCNANGSTASFVTACAYGCSGSACDPSAPCLDECAPGSFGCQGAATELDCAAPTFDTNCYHLVNPHTCSAGSGCFAGLGCKPCGAIHEQCCPGSACNSGKICWQGTSCELGMNGCVDKDEDGYLDTACGGTDCDDSNAFVNPGRNETCNGIDDNCNGQVDEGLVSCVPPGPCTPTNGGVETCDGIDNDCNGQVDETFICPLGALSGNVICGINNCTYIGRNPCVNQGGVCVWDTNTCVPYPENCFDTIDNDCNGYVDAADPACQ